MVAVPAAIPLTVPVAAFTLATAALPVVQVPPVVALLNVEVAPVHIVVVPVIAATVGPPVTVITLVAIPVPQPPLTA